MSIHRSLRSGGAMTRHRNVLTRLERLEKLEKDGRWTEEETSILGLPKVRSIKVAVKKKKKTEEEEGAAEGDAAAAP